MCWIYVPYGNLQFIQRSSLNSECVLGKKRRYEPKLSSTYEQNGTIIDYFTESYFAETGIVSLDTFHVSLSKFKKNIQFIVFFTIDNKCSN